ncbi:hypothetical protein ACOME3_006514 [Neoechinorhynchus agilis]
MSDKIDSSNPDSWSEIAWIQVYCDSSTLRRDKVLEYFCRSSNPFFDENCICESRDQIGEFYSLVNDETEEADSPHQVWIVVKKRRDYQETKALAYYAVFQDGKVKRAPTLYEVVSSRFMSISAIIRGALMDILPKIQYNASNGTYNWMTNPVAIEKMKSKPVVLPEAIEMAVMEDEQMHGAKEQTYHKDIRNILDLHFSEAAAKNRCSLYLQDNVEH